MSYKAGDSLYILQFNLQREIPFSIQEIIILDTRKTEIFYKINGLDHVIFDKTIDPPPLRSDRILNSLHEGVFSSIEEAEKYAEMLWEMKLKKVTDLNSLFQKEILFLEEGIKSILEEEGISLENERKLFSLIPNSNLEENNVEPHLEIKYEIKKSGRTFDLKAVALEFLHTSELDWREDSPFGEFPHTYSIYKYEDIINNSQQVSNKMLSDEKSFYLYLGGFVPSGFSYNAYIPYDGSDKDSLSNKIQENMNKVISKLVEMKHLIHLKKTRLEQNFSIALIDYQLYE